MTDGFDDMDADETKERLEQERAELEQLERDVRELLIEERRKRIELRCLEYIKFRIACGEAVEDKSEFYPETDPMLN